MTEYALLRHALVHFLVDAVVFLARHLADALFFVLFASTAYCLLPAADCRAEWIDVPARLQVSSAMPATLADVEARLWPGHPYRTPGEGVVNWVHEGTHGVNGRLRDGYRRRNVFYCLGGRAMVLNEPRLTLAHVAAHVPPQFRDRTYENNLVQQQVAAPGFDEGWNDRPLYVLDEWTAYTNGSIAGVESRVRDPSSLIHALKFCAFASALIDAVVAIDPAYRQLDELKAFVGWHLARVLDLAEHVRQNVPPMFDPEQDAVRAAFWRHYGRGEEVGRRKAEGGKGLG